MGFSLARRIRTVLRFVFPTRSQRRYERALRQSGRFDRAFYIAANPRLRALFRLAPERHYIVFGEALGLSPNPHFSPRAYLFHNPDLAIMGVAPLLHYIGEGEQQQRRVLLPADQRGYGDAILPEISAAAVPADPAPVAVVVHLFYHDMWDEFAAALRPQRFAFDLYVTITGTDADTGGLKRRILTQFPEARIWAMPNHGRDIFPFVHLVNAGVLDLYRAVCKLHSKKSPHRRDGDAWRRALTDGILGDPGQTKARLTAFLGDQRAGFWVADGQFYRGDEWWGPNRPSGSTPKTGHWPFRPGRSTGSGAR